MSGRVLSIDEMARVSTEMRRAGKRLVVSNGCFDPSVRALKGEGRPLNDEQARAEVLAALESVDYAAVFPEERATAFLERVQPAVYVKGGDYEPETLDPEERAALRRIGTEIKIIPFQPGYSTSGLIERLRAT